MQLLGAIEFYIKGGFAKNKKAGDTLVAGCLKRVEITRAAQLPH
jgi:hypothetical protein